MRSDIYAFGITLNELCVARGSVIEWPVERRRPWLQVVKCAQEMAGSNLSNELLDQVRHETIYRHVAAARASEHGHGDNVYVQTSRPDQLAPTEVIGERLNDIIRACWHPHPYRRPNVMDVESRLRQLYAEVSQQDQHSEPNAVLPDPITRDMSL